MASRRLITTCVKFSRNIHRVNRLKRSGHLSFSCQFSTETIPAPNVEGQDKVFTPKLHAIVDDISKLSLTEVADLNELLRKTLRIQDAPVMAMGMSGAVAAPVEEEEDEAPKIEKTAFTLKLVEFGEGKKIGLIKELKTLIPDMNLVKAKKFVESLPQVVKADVPKDEAETLKTALEAVGGKCEID